MLTSLGDRFADVGRLVVRCPDRPGIVAVLSRLLADVGANITESQQHSSDPLGGVFTLRLEFVLTGLATHRQHLEGTMSLLARQWGMTWRLTEAARRPTVAVFVSRADHVLQELIYRVRAGDTLWAIAAAHYGGDPREGVYRLEQRNHLVGTLVQPGQRLVLP